MAFPLSSTDAFESAGRVLGDQASKAGSSFNSGFNQSFNSPSPPSQSGLGSRQSRVPNERLAVTKRQMIRWLVPEQPMIEMYINPQNIQYQYSKQISEQRTKGGFVLQYWGENIIGLSISGTTGSSGIEGINVLYDIYRNEQLMLDPYALALQAERDRIEQSDLDFDLFGEDLSVGSLVGGLAGNVLGTAASVLSPQQSSTNTSRPKPTLASMAFTVELYWMGEVYRGYFKDFNVTESVTNLGLFDYAMNFRATQKRGFRTNYLGWHKAATNGPSNSSPFGPPHSFGALADGPVTPRQNNIDQPSLNSPFATIGNAVVKGAETIIDIFDL